MANIVQGITSLIGHTPLMEVGNIEKELSLQARVLVKLEYLNPAGSVKDRAARSSVSRLPAIPASVLRRSQHPADTG